MKSKKLNLNELRVKSFVTSLEDSAENTIKGGNDSNESNCCTGQTQCPKPSFGYESWCKCK